MAVYRKKTKNEVKITTAALPDIVFILLFFFMIVTVFKQENPLVDTSVPGATQSQKIQNQSLIIDLFIGKPKEKNKGSEPLISVGDYFIRADEIPQYIQSQISQHPDHEQPKLIVNLKVDQRVKMGIIQDIKQALRKVDARKVNYETISAIREPL